MERLQRGDWCYVGIRAEAEILLPAGDASIVQEITAGGLWGVESDSQKTYLADIDTRQPAEPPGQLRAAGFSTRAIGTAVKAGSHANAETGNVHDISRTG